MSVQYYILIYFGIGFYYVYILVINIFVNLYFFLSKEKYIYFL